MSKIYITGDTHGIPQDTRKFNTDNFPEGKYLTKEDVVIITGDFGWCWDNSKEEHHWLEWLNDKPFTVCFVDGNHENFDILNSFETIEKYDSVVGKIRDSIFWLKRGNIYNINDKKIFTFGGGLSHDKSWRLKHEKFPRTLWWPDEYPSEEELNSAWKNIMKHEKVDYVISHVPPQQIISDYHYEFGRSNNYETDLVSLHLRDMSDILKFEYWYHGHFHVDVQRSYKYISLYHKIIEAGKDL